MVSKALFSSATDEWATPQAFFDYLNLEFRFTLDPCATGENAKCDLFYSIDDDGLLQSWHGHRVFCNPPYSQIAKWIEKASKQYATSVLLIPARTDTRWFHQFVYDASSHGFQKNVYVRFVKGRLKFGSAKNSAPFPSMLVIFDHLELLKDHQ